MSDPVVRLNCEIPETVNNQLNALIPRGVKSDVIRELVKLYIDANKEYGRTFLINLLDGKTKLVEHNVTPEPTS